MNEMFGRRANLRRAWLCGSALVIGLGACASREGAAPSREPSASPANVPVAKSANPPASLSAEIDRAPLPIVPVVPTNPKGHGTEPTIAIVGAEQQSRLEPIRRRPAPMLYGLLTGHEPFLGEVEPGGQRSVT